jgi:hypothetical protein
VSFGNSFNRHVAVWPQKLTHVIFGNEYNQNVDAMATLYTLDTLVFQRNFNQSINMLCNLPKLRYLVLAEGFSQNPVIFAKSLQKIIYNNDIDLCITWPPNLETLIYHHAYDMPLLPPIINIYINILPDIWPNSIKHLIFGYNFNQPLNSRKLPEFLIAITFGYSFNQNIMTVLFPDTIMYMTFGTEFNQIITNVKWPRNILYIYDYSSTITYESSTFPQSLYQIIFIDEDIYINSIPQYEQDYTVSKTTADEGDVIYTRQIGQYTKAARRDK